jgi:predicted flap endonuclease-1-like 5' DNA nuclease
MIHWMAGAYVWLRLADDPSQGIPWWVWIFLIVFLVFLFFGLWMRFRGKNVVQPEKDSTSAAVEPRSRPYPVSTPAPATVVPVVEPVAPAPEPPPPPAPAVVVPVKPDDLVIIEGIGPKIAGILNNAGITTFAALAAAKPEQLQEIMKTSGLRVPADPTTWPAQAELAAAGKMDELQKLQDSLKGGRLA